MGVHPVEGTVFADEVIKKRGGCMPQCEEKYRNIDDEMDLPQISDVILGQKSRHYHPQKKNIKKRMHS